MIPREIRREFDNGIIYTAYHVGEWQYVQSNQDGTVRNRTIRQLYRYYVDDQEDFLRPHEMRQWAYPRQNFNAEQEMFGGDAIAQQNRDQYQGSDDQQFIDAQLCTWIEEYFLHHEMFPNTTDEEE